MLRTISCAALAFSFLAVTSTADAQAQKNQMVKGTVKSVNVKDGVLIVLQTVKNEKVERQLDIKDSTEFSITIGDETKELKGKDGLELLKEGASVQVKCDKDVNVLKVTAKIKK